MTISRLPTWAFANTSLGVSRLLLRLMRFFLFSLSPLPLCSDQLLTNVVGPGKVLLQSLPSLEAALVQQAEATSSALAASGAAPQSGMMSSPFGMGGMGGGLGSMVMQGAAFGVGSAIAHRAFDSAFGGSGSAGATPAAEAPPAEAPVDQDVGNGQEDGGDGSMFGGMFGGEEGGDDGDW